MHKNLTNALTSDLTNLTKVFAQYKRQVGSLGHDAAPSDGTKSAGLS